MYRQPNRVFAFQNMTKPSHGWGHQELEKLLTTGVIATVTVTTAATLTQKQIGQIIGANVGGFIVLVCIGGGIYFIRVKRGRKGDTSPTLPYGYGNKAELDVDIKSAELDVGNNKAELDADNERGELDINDSLGTNPNGDNVEPGVDRTDTAPASSQSVVLPDDRITEVPITETSSK